MGTLSMPASDSHTKYHWPPERSSDLLGDTVHHLCWKWLIKNPWDDCTQLHLNCSGLLGAGPRRYLEPFLTHGTDANCDVARPSM